MKHTGPLSEVRVVDLTAMVMGPYCTQIMADMGADVIKIEPPAGDNTRYISVGPEPGMAGVFVNVNRGKRSVMLDLRSDEGKTHCVSLLDIAMCLSIRCAQRRLLGSDSVMNKWPPSIHRSSIPTAMVTAAAAPTRISPLTTTLSRRNVACRLRRNC